MHYWSVFHHHFNGQTKRPAQIRGMVDQMIPLINWCTTDFTFEINSTLSCCILYVFAYILLLSHYDPVTSIQTSWSTLAWSGNCFLTGPTFGTPGTDFIEIWIKNKKMFCYKILLKMFFTKYQPFFGGLNGFTYVKSQVRGDRADKIL